MNRVIINSHYKKRFKHKRLFNHILNSALEITNTKGESEINLLIVDDNEMLDYCQQYKKSNKSTDVLSFPAEWENLSKLLGYNLLGDIIISFDHVMKQSKEYGHTTKREWAYLFAHGTLHLLGYDHIKSKEDESKMNELADAIMKKVKVSR